MRNLKVPAFGLISVCAQSPVDEVPQEAQQAPTLEKNPRVLRPRHSRVRIESLIRETHLDDLLQMSGLWRDWAAGKRGRSQ